MIILIPLSLFFASVALEFVVCRKAKGRLAKLALPLFSLSLVPMAGEWLQAWEGGSWMSLANTAALVLWCTLLLGCLVGWLLGRLWRHL